VLLVTDRFVLHRSGVDVADKSIAVLPFANTSGDAGNEYFSDGLSEELISSLTRLANLKVIGRTSSFQFKGRTDDSRAIGTALGVTYLLEGSVRKSADRVRIAVALLKAADGVNVWSDSYDRNLEDIFAVQSEIAGAVADQLNIALLGNNAQVAKAPTASKPPNGNLAAYTALMQANFHANRQTEADYRKAIGYYDEAIRLDPDYTLAYAGLAAAWTDLAAIWLGGDEGRLAYAHARTAVETAIRLGPDEARAHGILADLLLQHDFDVAAAGVEYRRALALAPTEALPKVSLATWLAAQGQFDEASGLMRQGIELDPLHTESYLFYSRSLLARGRVDAAEAIARKGLELQPQAVRLHTVATEIAILRGQYDVALAEAAKENAGFWGDFAHALALQPQADRAAADAVLHRFIERYADFGGSQIAILYAVRKDPDALFTWLDRGYETRDPGTLFLPFNDPFLIAYKDDPRFVAFVRKAGLLPVPETPP
jgi:TolB-like protein/Tfp pilus assembly protein PilF